MTAKEKALELGNKMYSGDVFSKSKQGHLDELELAKGRAIIAVDEIITALEELEDELYEKLGTSSFEERFLIDSKTTFYKEVKKEIEKL